MMSTSLFLVQVPWNLHSFTPHAPQVLAEGKNATRKANSNDVVFLYLRIRCFCTLNEHRIKNSPPTAGFGRVGVHTWVRMVSGRWFNRWLVYDLILFRSSRTSCMFNWYANNHRVADNKNGDKDANIEKYTSNDLAWYSFEKPSLAYGTALWLVVVWRMFKVILLDVSS